jgi:UDP-N-acetylglucosamine:LPS N-acetylglucosamine transferase
LADQTSPIAEILARLSRNEALTMATAARQLGKRDAAERVADACMELAGRRSSRNLEAD